MSDIRKSIHALIPVVTTVKIPVGALFLQVNKQRLRLIEQALNT